MKHLDLFSGIGGFALATEMVWDEVEHVFIENDPFCKAVLQKHWGSSKIYGDIKEFTWERYAHDVSEQEANLSRPTHGALPVEANTQKSTTKTTGQRDFPTQKIVDGGKDLTSTKCSETSATVAGKQSQSSFQSTISTVGEGMKNEGIQDTSTLFEKALQKRSIKSSALTATAPRDFTSNARTKQHDRTLTADAEYERCIRRGGASHTNELGLETGKQTREKSRSAITRRDEIGGYDLLTGGFPCQPFSQAGRRKGTGDDRFLWPEMLRIIREFRPRWVIGENVAGLLSIQQGVVFEQVCADLEGEGYAVQAFVIPAVAVNAPHRRDRVWIVAYDGYTGAQRYEHQSSSRKNTGEKHSTRDIGSGDAPNAADRRRKQPVSLGKEKGDVGEGGERYSWNQNWIEVATELCRVDARVSYWVDGTGKRRNDRNARLKALGNSIVPQVAAEIMRGIKEIDSKQ